MFTNIETGRTGDCNQSPVVLGCADFSAPQSESRPRLVSRVLGRPTEWVTFARMLGANGTVTSSVKGSIHFVTVCTFTSFVVIMNEE